MKANLFGKFETLFDVKMSQGKNGSIKISKQTTNVGRPNFKMRLINVKMGEGKDA